MTASTGSAVTGSAGAAGSAAAPAGIAGFPAAGCISVTVLDDSVGLFPDATVGTFVPENPPLSPPLIFCAIEIDVAVCLVMVKPAPVHRPTAMLPFAGAST